MIHGFLVKDIDIAIKLDTDETKCYPKVWTTLSGVLKTLALLYNSRFI